MVAGTLYCNHSLSKNDHGEREGAVMAHYFSHNCGKYRTFEAVLEIGIRGTILSSSISRPKTKLRECDLLKLNDNEQTAFRLWLVARRRLRIYSFGILKIQ